MEACEQNISRAACARVMIFESHIAGVQFEGDLGEILALGAEISPCIGLREKWESP